MLVSGLTVDQILYDLVNDSVCPGDSELLVMFFFAPLRRPAATGTGVDGATFWAALASIVEDFTPRNKELLAFREATAGPLTRHLGLVSDPC